MQVETVEVKIGQTIIGGGRPVAVQSMLDCSTMDTAACVEQIGRLRAAGCRIVRLAVQGVREAENLANIRAAAVEAGYGDVALVADVHFAPQAAIAAAEHADKVRINPGNFGGADKNFIRLIEKCRKRGVALRVGVNHGSLASHIVERWGDTPRGMVESAMEYLRVCREFGFDQVVVSMKSSNVRVMVHAYRLLAATMRVEWMRYPLHLGVTEAGDGVAGRVKSAVGIGALLGEGLGDTIRVSLTEPPENEIVPALALVAHFKERRCKPSGIHEYCRRNAMPVGNIGGGRIPLLYSELDAEARAGISEGCVAMFLPDEFSATEADDHPVILYKKYLGTSPGTLPIKAAADFGAAFVDGLADGIRIMNRGTPQAELDALALMILQAARARMSSTEYIACPGCGRTSYDLQGALAEVRSRTSHLAGLRIAVMGCIVNGPGEMADADYGYVGEGAGRVTIYRGREVVRRGVPQAEAADILVEVIKKDGHIL